MWYKMLAWNVEINLDICTWGKWVGLDWWQILSSDTTKVSHARPDWNQTGILLSWLMLLVSTTSKMFRWRGHRYGHGLRKFLNWFKRYSGLHHITPNATVLRISVIYFVVTCDSRPLSNSLETWIPCFDSVNVESCRFPIWPFVAANKNKKVGKQWGRKSRKAEVDWIAFSWWSDDPAPLVEVDTNINPQWESRWQ